ncbi:DAK2 domain-containing protein [Streptomyces sp. NPDC002088]|uniref:DAK2 domain-containing protein n=1 Tax=Streptomyces sp. NPDC002088 TaxID=3154665 RepID=UPI003328B782
MVAGPEALTRALTGAADGIRGAAAELAALDAVAGDGDLGITAAKIADALEETVKSGTQVPADELLRRCGLAVAAAAPSSCGTLIASGFLRAAQHLASPPGPAGNGSAASPQARVAGALRTALAAMAERGGTAVGDKSILDAIAPAVNSLEEADGADLRAALAASAQAAREGAAATARLVPRAGRAAWLADRSSGHVDAGAQLFACGWSGAVDALSARGRTGSTGWRAPNAS